LSIDQHKHKFSDGSRLEFHCRKLTFGISKLRSEDEDLGAYGDVVFSHKTITVVMTAGPLPEKVQVFIGPVTVRTVVQALADFYGTEISDQENAVLDKWNYKRRAVCKKYGDLEKNPKYSGLMMVTTSEYEFRESFLNYRRYEIRWGSSFEDFSDSDSDSA
jgi:hypothetical protein